MSGKEKIENILNDIGIKAPTFATNIGVAYQKIYDIQRGKTKKISGDLANSISSVYPQYNIDWLLSGKGKMLKSSEEMVKKLIPLYDDVSTIGGVNDRVANLQSVSQPVEYIDTGDWFKDATAAIRHYGESMVEYPSGCILALKEVQERELVIWGRDYVIETPEYRITKRVQRGDDSEHIKAYSTNIETYPDGQLIHEPQDIAWKYIHRIFLVLGYVVKKNGGTIVFSNQQNK